jgi:hypothetical protein
LQQHCAGMQHWQQHTHLVYSQMRCDGFSSPGCCCSLNRARLEQQWLHDSVASACCGVAAAA